MSRTREKEIDPEKRYDGDYTAPRTEIATSGWIVEAIVEIDARTDAVLFAVAELSADDAEGAVLRYPGILPGDMRIARRVLLATEISALGLRPGGVRPYDRRPVAPNAIPGGCS